MTNINSYNEYPVTVEFTHKYYTVTADRMGGDSYVLYVRPLSSDDDYEDYKGYYDSCGNCFMDDELQLPDEEDTQAIVELFVTLVQEQTVEVNPDDLP